MPFSFWEKESFFYHRHLIVCGAGFTGLSAAIYYKRKFPKKTVLVLEKSPINGGASTKNAGFACFGSPSELLADLRFMPEATVFGMVARRWKGLHNLRQLLGDKAIGYAHTHGYELFLEKDKAAYEHCREQLDYLNEKIAAITGQQTFLPADEKTAEFGFAGVSHVLESTAEGSVDTGRMYGSLLALARETGVDIFNGIEITGFEEGETVKVQTSEGTISCDRFLVANNGFAASLLPDSGTVPARAQVLITAPVPGLKLNGTFHMDEGFYYFRNVGDRVLLGGARNLSFDTETTTQPVLNERIQARLTEVLRTIILPNQEVPVAMRWAGIMGMGTEKSVIVKQLSEKTFCAIRLSGMGIALSTILGKEVVEIMGA